jgi:hypothetical protein
MMQKAPESVANSEDKTFDRWFPSDIDMPGKDQPFDAHRYISRVFRQPLQADASQPATQSVSFQSLLSYPLHLPPRSRQHRQSALRRLRASLLEHLHALPVSVSRSIDQSIAESTLSVKAEVRRFVEEDPQSLCVASLCCGCDEFLVVGGVFLGLL